MISRVVFYRSIVGAGFLSSNGANHCAAAWDVRGAPGVKKAFAALWQVRFVAHSPSFSPQFWAELCIF